MKKNVVSQKTGKKLLKLVSVKINPDAISEIEKQVKAKKYPSKNNAINIAVEEKFIHAK